MVDLHVNFIPADEIQEKAERILTENHYIDIPVDIDLLVEDCYGINILPLPNLGWITESHGSISQDHTTIYVDENVYYDISVRHRFTVAHEFAHSILHKEQFESMPTYTKDSWKDTVLSLDAKAYDWMETQADMFANFILIPKKHLEKQFNIALEDAKALIHEATQKGLERDTYLEYVISHISMKLAPKFEVHHLTMQTRLCHQKKLLDLIP